MFVTVVGGNLKHFANQLDCNWILETASSNINANLHADKVFTDSSSVLVFLEVVYKVQLCFTVKTLPLIKV